VLKKQGTAFVLNDYKTILYHAQQWRKRLVHKKIKSLPAHGAKRPFMENNDDQLPAASYPL
jgi:hypothetical protein